MYRTANLAGLLHSCAACQFPQKRRPLPEPSSERHDDVFEDLAAFGMKINEVTHRSDVVELGTDSLLQSRQ
jgi:hypothetical protein